MSNRFTYHLGKLVRDNILIMLEKSKVKVQWHTLSDVKYREQLTLKLVEEAEEVNQANSKEELKEELADLYQVLLSILEANDISLSELELARIAKNESKGAFDSKLFIDTVEIDQNHPIRQYYIDNPDKYPEIKDT